MHVRVMGLSALHHVVMVHRRHVRLKVALVAACQVVQVGHTHIETCCREKVVLLWENTVSRAQLHTACPGRCFRALLFQLMILWR